MPTLINGCGTRYAGRKNLTSRPATCKSCGRHGMLSSYDTRLCIAVVFIPVLPIARKRIIDECPSCRRHYVMKLHEWETRRQLGISGGIEDFRTDPTVEKGMAAHAAMVGFRELTQADEFRKELETRFPDSTRLQLYLAETDREHGHQQRADDAVRRAFSLAPEMPAARFAMAGVLRREGRLDEARRLLDLLEKPGAGANYPLGELELLAMACQQIGRHQEAGDLFRHLLRELPSLGQIPAFRKKVAASEKALGLQTASALPKRDRSLKALMADKKSRLAVLGGVAAVLITGGMVWRNEYVRRHRVVTVVNGLTKPLTVTLDGSGPAVTVAPGSRGKLTVAEGPHRAAVTGAAAEQIDFTVSTGYAERWTKDPAFILNPGGVVPLEFIKATYSKAQPPPVVRYSVGQRFSAYEDIDYLFSELPETLHMKESEVRTKTSLNVVREPLGQVVAYIAETGSRSDAMQAAESVLSEHPDDEGVLETYQGLVSDAPTEKRAMDFLAAGLTRRPLPMAWARVWQDLHQTPEAKAEMLAAVAKLSAAEPDNADLLYLHGRALPDGAESQALFEKARQLAPDNPWPLFALGYLSMERGQWKEARALFARTVELAPDSDRFGSLLVEARLGCGEGAAVAAELANGATGTPSVQFLRLRALAAAGDLKQGEASRRSFMDTLTNRKVDGDVIRGLGNQWYYMTRQFEELGKRNATLQTPAAKEARVWLALQNGDLAAADKDIALSKADRSNPTILDNQVVRLAVWIAAGLAGDETRFTAAQAAVAEGWKDEPGKSGGAAAALLSQTTDITQEQLDAVHLHPLLKGPLIAGLIHRHPGQRDFLASQAALFNVDLRFPSALIAKAIGAPVTASTSAKP